MPFKGREAVEEQRAGGVKKLMAGFTAPKEVILLGRETIYRNGERVGWLSSGGYGYTIGKSIGYGFVRAASGIDADFVMSGDYQLEVATGMVACEVHLGALYDSKMERIKC